MRKILTNKRGEAYIKTALIIIISIVIGGLLLGGLYLLFAGENGVMKQTDDKVYDMFNIGGEMTLKHEGTQLMYSYDGDTWKSVKVTGMDDTGRITNYFTLGEGDSLVHIVSYTYSSGTRVCSSIDGKEWITCVGGSSVTLRINASKTTVYADCSDGRSYYTTDGIDWVMTSTKRY